jgi:hypothetical protein
MQGLRSMLPSYQTLSAVSGRAGTRQVLLALLVGAYPLGDIRR